MFLAPIKILHEKSTRRLPNEMGRRDEGRSGGREGRREGRAVKGKGGQGEKEEEEEERGGEGRRRGGETREEARNGEKGQERRGEEGKTYIQNWESLLSPPYTLLSYLVGTQSVSLR